MVSVPLLGKPSIASPKILISSEIFSTCLRHALLPTTTASINKFSVVAWRWFRLETLTFIASASVPRGGCQHFGYFLEVPIKGDSLVVTTVRV